MAPKFWACCGNVKIHKKTFKKIICSCCISRFRKNNKGGIDLERKRKMIIKRTIDKGGLQQIREYLPDNELEYFENWLDENVIIP